MKNSLFILSLFIFLVVSCKSGNKKTEDQTTPEAFKQFELTELWRTDTVLLTPESVIYDKKNNVIYASSMNLEPRKKDGNGFISKISTEGKILDLRWADGLSSPKGLAISGDILYTVDVDEVVAIDLKDGKIISKSTLPGMKMLNDITSSQDGILYTSDTDANKIYSLSNGELTEWFTEGLNGPNGLLVDGKRLLVASQGSNDFATIDFETKTRTVVTDTVAHADGIAYTGIPGYYLVSDWGGEIFMIYPDFSKVSLINTKEQEWNSADIDYIPEMNMVIVPTFFKNCIIAYKLSEKID